MPDSGQSKRRLAQSGMVRKKVKTADSNVLGNINSEFWNIIAQTPSTHGSTSKSEPLRNESITKAGSQCFTEPTDLLACALEQKQASTPAKSGRLSASTPQNQMPRFDTPSSRQAIKDMNAAVNSYLHTRPSPALSKISCLSQDKVIALDLWKDALGSDEEALTPSGVGEKRQSPEPSKQCSKIRKIGGKSPRKRTRLATEPPAEGEPNDGDVGEEDYEFIEGAEAVDLVDFKTQKAILDLHTTAVTATSENETVTDTAKDGALKFLQGLEIATPLPPATAPELYQKGIHSMHNNQLGIAAASLSGAIQLEPDFMLALRARAFVYKKKHLLWPALFDIKRCVDLTEEKDSEVLFERSQIYRLLGRPQSALCDLLSVLLLDPSNVNAYVAKALVEMQIQNYPAAIASCSKAIELDPYHAAAFFNRAAAYGLAGLHALAKTDHDKFSDLKELQERIGKQGKQGKQGNQSNQSNQIKKIKQGKQSKQSQARQHKRQRLATSGAAQRQTEAEQQERQLVKPTNTERSCSEEPGYAQHQQLEEGKAELDKVKQEVAEDEEDEEEAVNSDQLIERAFHRISRTATPSHPLRSSPSSSSLASSPSSSLASSATLVRPPLSDLSLGSCNSRSRRCNNSQKDALEQAAADDFLALAVPLASAAAAADSMVATAAAAADGVANVLDSTAGNVATMIDFVGDAVQIDPTAMEATSTPITRTALPLTNPISSAPSLGEPGASPGTNLEGLKQVLANFEDFASKIKQSIYPFDDDDTDLLDGRNQTYSEKTDKENQQSNSNVLVERMHLQNHLKEVGGLASDNVSAVPRQYKKGVRVPSPSPLKAGKPKIHPLQTLRSRKHGINNKR